jgi:hypothetical protein
MEKYPLYRITKCPPFEVLGEIMKELINNIKFKIYISIAIFFCTWALKFQLYFIYWRFKAKKYIIEDEDYLAKHSAKYLMKELVDEVEKERTNKLGEEPKL